MKKLKGLLASLLAVTVVTGTATAALAAETKPTAADRLEKAIVYMKDTYAGEFAAGTAKANMWTLACAVGAGKQNDPDYAFMIPAVDADELDETTPLSEYATSILSLLLLEQDPSEVNGRDLVKELAAKQNADGGFTGAYGPASANELPFAILALDLAKGAYNQQGAMDAITALRKPDGGYSWDSSAAVGNVDTSGLALFCLADTDLGKDVLAPTVAYLKSTLNAEGFFVGKDAYATANACSQATAVLGLVTAGVDMSEGDYAQAVNALLSLQSDEGGFLYDSASEEPDYYSTYQGVLALVALKLNETPVTSPPETETTTDTTTGDSSDTAPATTSADSAATDAEQAVTTTSAGGAGTVQSGNHRTGDAGLNPLIIVVLVIAVAAVAACVVVPMVKKKKAAGEQPPEDQDDSDRFDS